MEIPEWADESLSGDLAVLRSRGEAQDLEYMESFPKNARELGKEVAAFASTNSGTIILGVTDTGELIGLDGCEEPEGRDQLMRRLEGICRGTIKPSVTPTAKFAIEDGKVALVITVPRGKQPVYYSNNVPYVRHLTESRPAEPHEVIEKVLETANQNTITSTAEQSIPEIYSSMARLLIEVIIYGEEIEDRDINPWLEIWRSEYGAVAGELRALAASSDAIGEGLNTDFLELADLLDAVGNMRLHLGSGNDLRDGVHAAVAKAQTLMGKFISGIPLSDDSLAQIRDLLAVSNRRLSDLVSRAMEMIESGRVEELQTNASEFGHDILKVAYYNLSPLGTDFGTKLRRIGHSLHRTETMRIYLDGGHSIEMLYDHVRDSAKELEALCENL